MATGQPRPAQPERIVVRPSAWDAVHSFSGYSAASHQWATDQHVRDPSFLESGDAREPSDRIGRR